MNIPVGMDYQQTRQYLQRQMRLGRYMILGTVIITVVNLVFLLVNFDFYISYSAALAYYPACLGKLMDNGWFSILGPNGVYTCTGLVLSGVVLAVLLAMWILAKKDVRWLKGAIGALVLDAAALVAFALVFLEGGVLSIVWELVIHIAVIWEMGQALSARKLLTQAEAREAARLQALAEEAEAMEAAKAEEVEMPEHL